MTANSVVSGWIFAEIKIHPSFNACSHYPIGPKTTEKSGDHFPHCKSVCVCGGGGGIFRRSRTDNSAAGNPIWQKFVLNHDILHVLITCKVEKDRLNSNREKVATLIFRRPRAANSVVSSGIWPKSNSSKRLCMFSLPASMKRTLSETAEKM